MNTDLGTVVQHHIIIRMTSVAVHWAVQTDWQVISERC